MFIYLIQQLAFSLQYDAKMIKSIISGVNIAILQYSFMFMQSIFNDRFQFQRQYQMFTFSVFFQLQSKLAAKIALFLVNQDPYPNLIMQPQIYQLSLQQFLYIVIQLQIVFLALIKLIYGKQNMLICLIITNLLFFMLSISPPLSLHQQLLTNINILALLMLLALLGFLSIALLDRILKKQNLNFAIRRKLFHFVPVLVIVLMENLHFLCGHYRKGQIQKYISIMITGNFYIMFMLQCVRYFLKENTQSVSQRADKNITYFVQKYLNRILSPIFEWMQQFNKDNRQKHLLLTHLYLYLGLITGHMHFSQGNSSVKVINVCCIMMLADAMAAIIGRKYGMKKVKIQWMGVNTNKSYLGSLAFFVTTFTILLAFWNRQISLVGIFQICLISLVCMLAELFSGDLDNIITVSTFILIEYVFN